MLVRILLLVTNFKFLYVAESWPQSPNVADIHYICAPIQTHEWIWMMNHDFVCKIQSEDRHISNKHAYQMLFLGFRHSLLFREWVEIKRRHKLHKMRRTDSF